MGPCQKPTGVPIRTAILLILVAVLGPVDTRAQRTSSADGRNNSLFEMAGGEQAALMKTLEQLVNIESGSRDQAGLRELSALLVSRLQGLGAETQVYQPNTTDTYRMFDSPAHIGSAVIGRYRGSGTRKILLMAHMDTVYEHGTLARRPFRIEGNRAFGPGIADDKGGIAMILHTLAMLKTLGFRDYSDLTIIIDGDEEVSTPGTRALIQRIGAESDIVFSCEPPPTKADGIALATSGIAAATLVVHGKASHAGVSPELGRNAIIELAHRVLATNDLSDASRGIKFNWTLASGGATRNVIPNLASASADVRVRHVPDLEVIERTFRERVAAVQPLVPDTRIELGFERRRPPLEVTAGSRSLAAAAQAIYAEVGKTLLVDDSGNGGGTDAAFAGLSGKAAVIESLGLVGFGFHSPEEEYVDLNSIQSRLYLLTRLVMDAGRTR
jgi:glutamate carboxypeptidase